MIISASFSRMRTLYIEEIVAHRHQALPLEIEERVA